MKRARPLHALMRLPEWTDMRVRIVCLAALACAACGPGAPPGPSASHMEHCSSERWARHVEMAGVPNFFGVTSTLYRSAQPTARGMRTLEKMGVKTIINLRSMHSDLDEIGVVDIRYVHIPMSAWHPEEEDILEFLSVVTDKDLAPVLVHCNHGADRTGFMCAIYRVCVCGWTRDEAIAEMVDGGFGFHRIWGDLPRYIENLDVRALRLKAGLTGVTERNHN